METVGFFAAFARVLQDLPKTDPHRAVYIERFRSDEPKHWLFANSLKGIGHGVCLIPNMHRDRKRVVRLFSRTLFLWGMNNGYLDMGKYEPVIKKSWDYLQNTALQPDGRVGYVQPIGEKAIPGQVVDTHSTANFGVGVFSWHLVRWCVTCKAKINKQVKRNTKYEIRNT